MDRETLISIINRNGIRFLSVRRCSLCNEYIGYKFVKMCDGSMIPVFSSGCGCCGVNTTKDERQEFIDALKASEEPKAKMCLKQFFGIKIEPEYKFKPFDKVLVRDTKEDDWHVSLFVREIADAQYKEERYECLNGTGWIYCIPYEGNEHLL